MGNSWKDRASKIEDVPKSNWKTRAGLVDTKPTPTAEPSLLDKVKSLLPSSADIPYELRANGRSPIERFNDLPLDVAQVAAPKAFGYLNGAANAVTLHHMPQVSGTLNGAYDTARDVLTPGQEVDFGKRYQENKDNYLRNQREIEKEMPIMSATGEVAGSLLLPMPGKSASVWGRLAKTAGAGLAYGAATNPGDEIGKSATDLDSIGGEMKSRALHGVGGSVIATGLHLPFEAPVLARKGINTFLGPSTEAIDKYLENAPRINQARSSGAMKDSVDTAVNSLRDRVASGEMGVKEAKKLIDALDNRIADTQKMASTEFSNSVPMMRETLERSKQDVDNKATQIRGEFASTPSPVSIAPDVHGAVGTLKKQVVDEAAKARDILAESGTKVKVQPIIGHIDDEIEKRLVNGAMPATAQARAEVERLQELKLNLKNYGPELSGNDARKVMKDLDNEVQYGSEAGGFSDSYDQAVKGARKQFDLQLKDNDEYKKQMAKVAEKADLLSDANKLFGTPEKAYSALKGITGETRVPQREVLSKLGEHTENDFVSPIENYSKAQGALKNGAVDEVVSKTPEADKLKDAKLIMGMLEGNELKNSHVAQTLEESGLPKQRLDAENELTKRMSTRDAAKAEAEPFQMFTPETSQAKINRAARATGDEDIELRRRLEGLQKYVEPTEAYKNVDNPLIQEIEDRGVLNEFDKNNTNGSRNVNLWSRVGGATVGGATGAFLGDDAKSRGMGAAAGMSMGAVGGAYIDKEGPAMAKAMLDFYLKHKGAIDTFQQQTAQSRNLSPWAVMQMSKGSDQ